MLLLAFQSWSIHGRQRRLHGIAGVGSLVLFPFFLAGSMAVVLSMAQATLVWANGADFAPEFLHDNVRVTA